MRTDIGESTDLLIFYCSEEALGMGSPVTDTGIIVVLWSPRLLTGFSLALVRGFGGLQYSAASLLAT